MGTAVIVADPSVVENLNRFCDYLSILAQGRKLAGDEKQQKARDLRMGRLLGNYKPGSVKNMRSAAQSGNPDKYRRVPIHHFEDLQSNFQELVANNAQSDLRKPELEEEIVEWLTSILGAESNSAERPSPEEKPRVKTTNMGPLINGFENTQWYCYEREGSEEDEEEKISRKVLVFDRWNEEKRDKEGYFPVHLHIAEADGVRTWTGKASFEYGDGLLVGSLRSEAYEKHLHRKGQPSYTHLAIKVNESASHSFCIGHKTFVHKVNGNIVTKTIVLQKLNSEESSGKPKLFSFKDESLDLNIRIFLEKRHLNRLSSPRVKLITSKGVFDTWMKYHHHPSDNLLNRAIVGNYDVYYLEKPAATVLSKRTIEFSLSLSGNVEAKFFDKGKQDLLKGQGTENASATTMSFVLHRLNKNKLGSKQAESTYFLMLVTPEGKVDSIDTMLGIISGIRDRNRGPVARLIVLTNPDQVTYPKEQLEKYILSFLNILRDQGRARPPYDLNITKFLEIIAYINKKER